MQNVIMFVTGRKGSGKTTFAAAMARSLYLDGHRVIILDPMNGFDLPGSPRVSAVADLPTDRIVGRSFLAMPGTDGRLPAAVFLYAYTCGNLTLVVDEVDLYLPHGGPDDNLLNIIRYGRHRGLNLIAISQRPANVVRDLTAQSDYIVMFQTSEPRDLDYLAGRIGKDNADKVAALPQFHPAIYSAYEGGLTDRVDGLPMAGSPLPGSTD